MRDERLEPADPAIAEALDQRADPLAALRVTAVSELQREQLAPRIAVREQRVAEHGAIGVVAGVGGELAPQVLDRRRRLDANGIFTRLEHRLRRLRRAAGIDHAAQELDP